MLERCKSSSFYAMYIHVPQQYVLQIRYVIRNNAKCTKALFDKVSRFKDTVSLFVT